MDSGSAGTVASVSVTAPLQNTGTATNPIIGLNKANGGQDGYLSSADYTLFAGKLSNFSSLSSADVVGALTYAPLAPATQFSGDVTGTYNTTSVTKIRGVAVDVAASTPASGDVLRYDGTKYIAAAIPSAPVSSVAGRTGAVTLTSSDITGLGIAAGMNVGTAAGTVAAGNDSRFTDARAPSGAASGDLSGTYPNPTLGKIQGVNLNITALASGNFLKYNGTNWINATPAISDIANLTTQLSNKLDQSNMPASCSVGQTLTFSSPTGTWLCSNIALSISQVSGLANSASIDTTNASNITSGTLSAARLPTSVTDALWSANASGDVYRTSGNVGVGVTTPTAKLHLAASNGLAGNSPLKMTAGTNLTTPESGAFEYDGTNLYFTDSALARKIINNTTSTVKVATTGNITLSGEQTIDGIAIVSGDRVLVKAQTTSSQNGVYVASSGTWTRAADLNSWPQTIGYQIKVVDGLTWMGMTFNALTVPGGTMGTTDIDWAPFGIALGRNFVGGGPQSSIVIGERAMENGDYGGNANIAIGNWVMKNQNGAVENVVVGNWAMSDGIASGFSNVAIGNGAMSSAESASDNTAVGVYSMSDITTGRFNVAVGESSLSITTGNDNTAIGYAAGYRAVGASSGNVFIGELSGPSVNTTLSNTLWISNTWGTPLIYGDFSAGSVGLGTTTPSEKLDVNGTATMKASTEGASTYINSSTAYTIPDATLNIRRVTLTANTTITLPAYAPTSVKVYTLTVFLKQDATGLRTIAWAGNGADTIKWDGGTAPTISTTANKITILQFTKPSDEAVWYASKVWQED